MPVEDTNSFVVFDSKAVGEHSDGDHFVAEKGEGDQSNEIHHAKIYRYVVVVVACETFEF